MSNYLAIATVTATLQQILQPVIQSDVTGASVTIDRPEDTGNNIPDPEVRIYLYQVTPNAAWRNADLPTRDSVGQPIQCPQIALDLHYLLTFYGNEGDLVPQRLLGSVVRTLHAQPILPRQAIRDTIANAPYDELLESSDLADQIELVKFTPISLSLEELSKIWSVFFQIPHTLSIAYQASVVLIESEESLRRPLPVRDRNIYAVPFGQPIIERVTSQAGINQPIVAGDTLRIQGRRLRGADATKVRIFGVEVTPLLQEVSNTQISLELASPPIPASALRAGVQSVQVIHEMSIGTPAVPHNAVESNAAAFVLRPTITNVSFDAVSTEVTVTLNPDIGSGQRVVLLLNELSNTDPAAYTFVAEPPTADTNSITIPISGVQTGDYLVRVQVDGAESPLTVDTNEASPTFNQYIEPKVTIT